MEAACDEDGGERGREGGRAEPKQLPAILSSASALLRPSRSFVRLHPTARRRVLGRLLSLCVTSPLPPHHFTALDTAAVSITPSPQTRLPSFAC